jgi:4-diphosphocytidyl-2-C-methyl-D-erythritol kinase
MKLKSFAKLNLSLLVFRPRKKDGYHPLCSVFQTISLYDELNIKILPHQKGVFKLRCSNPEVPVDEKNLLTKLYLRLKAKIPFGLQIYLKKNIPMGGGLGGGSSNAAVFLQFLNQYVPLNYTKKQLVSFALSFGADIPFFLEGGTSLVRGIGEKLKSIKPGPYKYFVLINPQLHLDTKQIYQAFDQDLATTKNPGRTPKDILKKQVGENSLKPIVFRQHKLFQELEHKIKSLGYPLYMTGSGSSLFIPLKKFFLAKELVTVLKKIYADKFIFLARRV